MNLLQAAGFSRSNPYYIVPQGRITALTNAHDDERLELLKEVAGTRVYEDHRQESLKILEETATKQAKITELLGFIDERLVELEEEKEELQKFQALDRQKRACEFLLFSREAAEAAEALDRLETEESEEQEQEQQEETNSSASTDALEAQLDAINQLERELTNQKQQLQEAERDAEISRLDLDDLQAERARLTVIVADWSATSGTHNRDVSTLRTSLQRIEEEISRKETELLQLAPLKADWELRQESLRRALEAEEAEKASLIAKQGRFCQFKSASDRNVWIESQLKTLTESALPQSQQSHQEAQAALNEARDQESRLTTQIAQMEQDATGAANRRHELDAAVIEARKARDVATDTRKELWRAEGKLQSALTAISEQVTTAQRSLAGAIDRVTWQGLETIRRSANEKEKVHGPLYELFQVSDSIFRPAVEAIAGSTLFNVVVADDSTATRLLDQLNREKGGRVTFIPLNRIKKSIDEDDNYDDDEINPSAGVNLPKDCVRLLDRISYSDPALQGLFESIFGKAVLVPDLNRDLLAQIRSMGLTAITLEGDRADRRGTLFGGSLDSRKSRLELAARLATWRNKQNEHAALLSDLSSRLLSADQHVTRTVSALVALEQERSLAAPERLLSALNSKRNELESIARTCRSRQESLDSIANELASLERDVSALRTELGQPLARSSDSDRARLAVLNEQITAHGRELDQMQGQRDEIVSRVAQLEGLLSENLRKRRLDLLTRLAALAPRGDDQVTLQGQLETVLISLAESQERLASAMKLRDQSAASIASLSTALERSRGTLEELQRRENEKGSHLEKFMSRRALLLQRREECSKRIRELGVIAGDPEMESVESRLRDLSTPAILATLADCTTTIKTNFSTSTRPPPNRKAVELHANFSRQAETLQSRHSELQNSAASISEFIRVLDQRKDEAIMRTFEQVKENFERVFERLCPAGFAKLVMIRDEAQHQTEPTNKRTRSKITTPAESIFSGIGIKASFLSKSTNEGLLISQLSGGQKSLLALALIFAIQLVDPAPFYLFDEIDANLDAAARTAVAGLIHHLANPHLAAELGGDNARAAPPAQFITTTFRPEMLKHADSFFGVSFAGRVSKVDQISPEQALQFIEHFQE